MERLAQNIQNLRKAFPLLQNPKIVYLDNAATTQKPECVLEAARTYYEAHNANPFRGVYELSETATREYEAAREAVARFIHAKDSSQIVFTRNATESLNLAAYSYGLSFLKPEDEIVVSVMEHHSNYLPWKMAAEKTGAKCRKLLCNEEGVITEELLRQALNGHTKIVAVTHISNVFGQVNDLKRITEIAHSYGAVVVADGAQSVPHMPVDVEALDVDFLVFSGHKMLAPMGIGVLYGKKELLEKMPPFLSGGEMIQTVHWDRVTYAQVPHKFEAGTVNVGGAAALKAAVSYYDKIGFDMIMAQEGMLTKLALEGMKQIEGVRVLGSSRAEDHYGILTFTVEGVHPHDVASILETEGICIRAGHHCAQPLLDFLNLNAACRISFAFYNTEEEVRLFLKTLAKVRGLMGYD